MPDKARVPSLGTAILVGKFGDSITAIGPDFKPVAFLGSSLVGGHRRVRPGLGGRLRHAPRMAAMRR
jgi:hypothetical protein